MSFGLIFYWRLWLLEVESFSHDFGRNFFVRALDSFKIRLFGFEKVIVPERKGAFPSGLRFAFGTMMINKEVIFLCEERRFWTLSGMLTFDFNILRSILLQKGVEVIRTIGMLEGLKWHFLSLVFVYNHVHLTTYFVIMLMNLLYRIERLLLDLFHDYLSPRPKSIILKAKVHTQVFFPDRLPFVYLIYPTIFSITFIHLCLGFCFDGFYQNLSFFVFFFYWCLTESFLRFLGVQIEVIADVCLDNEIILSQIKTLIFCLTFTITRPIFCFCCLNTFINLFLPFFDGYGVGLANNILT